MTNKSEHKVDTQQVKDAASKAVEQGSDIRNEVRDLTLKILSQGHLDIKKMNQVLHAVLEGASIGAEAKSEQVKNALTDALKGIDEALAKSAEASKLAIEETAGHVKNFSNHDFKQAVDDLQTLEKLFIDTVQDVAKGANEMVKGILSDLVKHAQQSGTSVGKTSLDAVTSLNQTLGNTLKDTATASAHATLEVASHIANAAAGILEGFADTIHARSKEKSDQE